MGDLSNLVQLEKSVFDWGLLHPDLGNENVRSVLCCAILCCSQPKCSTINVIPEETHFLCQKSRRKATCMEKDEAFVNPGSRMYQKKANNIRLLNPFSPLSICSLMHLGWCTLDNPIPEPTSPRTAYVAPDPRTNLIISVLGYECAQDCMFIKRKWKYSTVIISFWVKLVDTSFLILLYIYLLIIFFFIHLIDFSKKLKSVIFDEFVN
jgi:hypothetical protein